MKEKEYEFSCCYDFEIDGVAGRFTDTDVHWYSNFATLDFYLKYNGQIVYCCVMYKNQLNYGLNFVLNVLNKSKCNIIRCSREKNDRVFHVNPIKFSREMYKRVKLKIADNILMLYSSAASNDPVICKGELWDKNSNEYYEIPCCKFNLVRRGKKYKVVGKFKLGGET